MTPAKLVHAGELVNAVGISFQALAKFEDFGFVSSWIVRKEYDSEKYYSVEDSELIMTMKPFWKRFDLRTAHRKAKKKLNLHD